MKIKTFLSKLLPGAFCRLIRPGNRTSTVKQVLGNCERMVFASFVGNFNFDSFNPNFLFTCAVNFYLMIRVVNLYIVLVYCYTMLLG